MTKNINADIVEKPNEPAKKSVKLSSLIYLLRYLNRYQGHWFGAMAALVFTSAMTLSMGQGVRYVIDTGFGANSAELLGRAVAVFMVLALLFSLGTYIRYYLVSWLGERVSADIRRDVFDHLVSLHPGYFETNRSGEIASRITTDTTLLQTIIGSSISMALRSVLNCTGGLILLFITNLKLMAVVLLAVPIVVLPLRIFGRRVKKLSRDSQDTIADVGSYAAEIIQNIKTVQSYAQEQREQRIFDDYVTRAFRIAIQRIKQRALLMAIVMALIFSSLCAMLWVGGNDVINGVMTAGELGAFVFYALMVAMSIATVAEVYGELQRAAGATDRLIELLNVEREIAAPRGKSVAAGSLPPGLDLDGLSFSYPSRPERRVLDNVTLSVKEGECVALVGPSGAGKTTIFDLVQRFYDPQQGAVKFGGVDIRELQPSDVREQLAVVAQHPSLFTADVATNICYGKPNASEQEIIDAAKAAYAHEFIVELPEGYKSFLGEQGVRLSGGQKQRIAIARAVLTNPRILLLDEATSALDSESEHFVQRALEALMDNRTTIIIAHRLSTVLHADRIVVMDAGKIVAEGSHKELLRSSPLYARFANRQFKDDVG